MALTDLQLKQATPRDREWKLADGGGLYILVRPNGSKLWRMKYRQHGREKKLTFGSYPEVGLREARLLRDEASARIGPLPLEAVNLIGFSSAENTVPIDKAQLCRTRLFAHSSSRGASPLPTPTFDARSASIVVGAFDR